VFSILFVYRAGILREKSALDQSVEHIVAPQETPTSTSDPSRKIRITIAGKNFGNSDEDDY
jgi:hypothetical protein